MFESWGCLLEAADRDSKGANFLFSQSTQSRRGIYGFLPGVFAKVEAEAIPLLLHGLTGFGVFVLANAKPQRVAGS